MPGIAVSLSQALEISKWEGEEPLKVEVPPEAAEPGHRRAGGDGEASGRSSKAEEEPQKVELSPGALPWACSPASKDCPAKRLGESPLEGMQLSFCMPLAEASPLAIGGQDFIASCLSDSPGASALQEADCCDALQAWAPLFDADTAAASPATSSGSDYDSSPDGESFYSGGFEPLRLWDPMPVLPVDAQGREDPAAGFISDSPMAPAMPLHFPAGGLPEAAQLPADGQVGPPSSGSALHGTGQCRPCAWVHKPVGCQSGHECDFCHLCPEGTLKAKKKSKLAMKAMKRMSTLGECSPQDQPRFAINLASLI